MLKFQYISDLHIEASEEDVNPLDFVNPSYNILILAGDIGSLYKIKQLSTFLESISFSFKFGLIIQPSQRIE